MGMRNKAIDARTKNKKKHQSPTRMRDKAIYTFNKYRKQSININAKTNDKQNSSNLNGNADKAIYTFDKY